MHETITRLIDDFERGALNRRRLIANLVALSAGAAAGSAASGQSLWGRGSASRPAAPQAPDAGSTFQATAINHVAIRVTDIPRSRDFYVKHLGLQVASESNGSCFLDCGEDFLALFKADGGSFDHYCYTIVDYDPGRSVAKLEAAGLRPERRGNRVYFKDPDGIEVQVSAPNRRR